MAWARQRRVPGGAAGPLPGAGGVPGAPGKEYPAADPAPDPAPALGGIGGGGGFLTSLSRSTASTSSSRTLSTSPARGELRSCTQYELPSAITSITVGSAVDEPVALRSIL